MKQKIAKNFIWCGFAVILLALPGCAVKPTTKPQLFSQEEERWIKLNEELSQQRDEIKKLELALRDVEKRSSPKSSLPATHPTKGALKKSRASSKPEKSSALPVEKLKPLEEESLDSPNLDPIAQSFQDEATVADSSQEAMHHYFTGLELYEEKKYDQAIKSLTQFVSLQPRHVYADRAQYWIAESAFQSKEYNLAVVATNLMEARYPYSLKMPETLHIRALSFANLKQAQAAKIALEKMMSRYPKHPLSVEAENGVTAALAVDETTAKTEVPPLMPSSTDPDSDEQN
jgi:TolA-binding protein